MDIAEFVKKTDGYTIDGYIFKTVGEAIRYRIKNIIHLSLGSYGEIKYDELMKYREELITLLGKVED